VELYFHSPNTPSWRGAQLKHRDNFTFTFTLYQVKEDEMGGICSTHVTDEKLYKVLIGKPIGMRAFGRFRCRLEESIRIEGYEARIGFIWLRIGTSRWFL
jgi:hypothetical protein